MVWVSHSGLLSARFLGFHSIIVEMADIGCCRKMLPLLTEISPVSTGSTNCFVLRQLYSIQHMVVLHVLAFASSLPRTQQFRRSSPSAALGFAEHSKRYITPTMVAWFAVKADKPFWSAVQPHSASLLLQFPIQVCSLQETKSAILFIALLFHKVLE